MVYLRGSSIVPIIITILFVVVAAVVAVFFRPAPEPRILITNVSPIPRNGERVLAEQFIELKWEAVYERPRQGLMAEVFAGEDRNGLIKLAQDIEGTLTSQSEGIFSFVFRYPVEPHPSTGGRSVFTTRRENRPRAKYGPSSNEPLSENRC